MQQGIVTEVYGDDNYRVFISGNHDQNIVPGIAERGDYGVFVINEGDFMWQSNTGYAESYAESGLPAEQIVKQTAANLEAYLKAKLNEGFDKPIFIVSHLALHYSMRTRNDGDECMQITFSMLSTTLAIRVSMLSTSSATTTFRAGTNILAVPRSISRRLRYQDSSGLKV